jgi:hypothetical protein
VLHLRGFRCGLRSRLGPGFGLCRHGRDVAYFGDWFTWMGCPSPSRRFATGPSLSRRERCSDQGLCKVTPPEGEVARVSG